MPTTGWIADLQDNDENWVVVPGSDLNLQNNYPDTLPWMENCVRTGSRRKGDYTIQEVLDGPWGTAARDCAITHATYGARNITLLWAGVCPTLPAGTAELELIGNSGVTYHYSSNPGAFPAGADSAHMTVTTVAYGIYLQPVIENLTERGVLSFPDPETYGAPADATITWEEDQVTVWKVEIADAAGQPGSDPDSRYAVNYNLQPDFASGSWGAWTLGFLPGTPLAGQPSALFASEPVDHAGKTWHGLTVPATITQDYLNDRYDYGVAAGPSEAFGERVLNATRTASTGLIVKVYVRSPRFKFDWGLPSIPPRRIFGRSDGATHGSPRVLGGGNTVQGGRRVLGGIL